MAFAYDLRPPPVDPRVMDRSGFINGLFDGLEKGRTRRQNAQIASAVAGDMTGMPVEQQPGGFLSRLFGGGQPSADGLPTGSTPADRGAQISVSQPQSNYLASLRWSESGGDDQARNPNSSAQGRYQFTDDTWNGLAKNYPGLGLTPDGRADPDQQEQAVAALTRENSAALQAAGIPVDNGSLYAAHFLGAPTAPKVWQAPDDVPVRDLVAPEVLQANPFLGSMNAGQFRAWAGARGGMQEGRASSGAPVPSAGGQSQGRFGGLSPSTMASMLRSEEWRPYALQLMQGQSKPTSDMIEYQFAREQGYRGSLQDWMTGLRSAGATRVNVGDKGAGKFTETANKYQAERYGKIVDSADESRQLEGDVQALGELLSTVGTGRGAEWRLSGAQFARSLGLDDIAEGLSGGKLGEMEAAQALVDKLTPRMRVPGSGATSDAEMRTFRNSLPNLLRSPGGNEIVVQTFMSLYRYQQQAGDIAGQALRNEITQRQADQMLRDLDGPFEQFKAWRKANAENRGGAATSDQSSPSTEQPVRTPPSAAIEALRANPDRRAEFDAYYGAGAADRILGGSAR